METNNNVNGTTGVSEDEGLYAESGGRRVEFAPCPAKQQQAVLVDIRPLGMIEVFFEGESKGKKPHLLWSWQSKEKINLKIEEDDDEQTREFKTKMNGKPYIVSQRYVNSLADNARMRKDIEGLLGRKLTRDELKPKGFNLEALVGMNGLLNVVHNDNPKDKKTYANINGVMGWNTDFGAPIVVSDYVRFKDRPKDEEGNVLKGDALKVATLKKNAREAMNEAATYGLPVPGVNPDAMEPDALINLINTLEDQIKKAKKKLTNQPGDDLDSLTATEAFEKRTGHAPDVFADEGEPGYIEDEAERARIQAEGKPEPAGKAMELEAAKAAVTLGLSGQKVPEAKHGRETEPKRPPAKTTLKEASLAPKTPASANLDTDDGDSAGEGAFELTPLDMAKGQWALERETEPFPAFLEAVFTEAADAELKVGDKPLTDEVFLANINEFLKADERKTIASLFEIKAASAGVVAKAIRGGNIAF